MTKPDQAPAAPRKSAANTRGRPFAPGNPGKPRGARHKVSRAVEALMEGEAEALSRKAIELALAGDLTALKLCLDRIAPARKEPPSPFALPEISGASDLPGALSAVLAAVSAGELSVAEGKAAAEMIDASRRAFESSDLARRVEALEARHGRRS